MTRRKGDTVCIHPRTFIVERDLHGEKISEEVTTACRECWQCKERWISDMTGRALAEAWDSTAVCAVTLTYAPRDDGAEKVVTKRHAQQFIRSVRRRGHEVRYIIVSEKGEKLGRVHFHAVLFFKGNSRPDWAQRQRIHCPTWPHGLIFVDWGADDRAFRYALKYTFKDAGTLRNWRSLSKKPPIGHNWFMAKAQTLIDNRVMPRSFTYAPPNARAGKEYCMSGTTRRNYINAVMDGLRSVGVCPISISNEMVHSACEAADKWAVQKEQEEWLSSLDTEAQEAHFLAEWRKHLERKGVRQMTDQDAERYLNRLAIACAMEQHDLEPPEGDWF